MSELTAAIAIFAVALIVVLFYQNKAASGASVHQTSSAIANLSAKVRGAYRARGSYQGLSSTVVNRLGAVSPPLAWDGTNIVDPWGNVVTIEGNPDGHYPRFGILIGGSTAPLPKQACITIAAAFAQAASRINVGQGAQLVQALAANGSTYKDANGNFTQAALPSACSQDYTKVALQFN